MRMVLKNSRLGINKIIKKRKKPSKIRVEKIIRLVEERKGKTRPMNVSLGSTMQARRVLNSKMILKNKEDKWGKVFIDEDLN